MLRTGPSIQLLGPVDSANVYSMYGRNIDLGLLLLRLGVGLPMLLTHGLPKLMRILDGNFKFGDPLGIGAAPSLVLVTLAEAGCSLLIVLGLFTRLATLPLIIAMFVAAFLTHWADGWGKMEMAFIYLMAFATLAFTGPGSYSLDERWRARMV